MGGALGLRVTTLKKIASDHKKADDALNEVIMEWLSQANIVKHKSSEKPTWRALAKAVADSGGGANRSLAEKIAVAHPGMHLK